MKNFYIIKVFLHLFLALGNVAFCQAETLNSIQPVRSFQQIEDYFNSYDPREEETLLIWDIDDVLVMPKDSICNSNNKKIFEENLNKHIAKLSEEEQIEILSIALSKKKIKIVDPLTFTVQQKFREKKIKSIALTNGWTGKYGVIESLEDFKRQELKEVGYDFSDTFPNLPATKFNIASKDPKRFPVYKAGILWTCNLPKGLILSTFFKYADYKPKRIIFVDDKLKNIHSVEKYCKENNIKFQGFHYVAPANYTSPLNKDLIEVQFYNLVNNKIWLSDMEAEAAIKSGALPRKDMTS